MLTSGRRACVWTAWLLLAACSLLGGCQTTRNVALFAPASWTGLAVLSEDVRVEATAGPEQRAQALRLRDEANARLNAAMRSVQSRPVHVFCFSEACYQGFGGGSPRAKSFGHYRTLIGPHGMTAAIVAHEWWHADLHSRLGFWSWRKVPTWFDEGTAVWISDDPRYGEAMYQRVLVQGITPPTLDELATRDGFIAAIGRYGDHLWASKPPDAVTVVYPTAAREVRRWLQIVGTDGLRELVARLARGETFATAYAELEAHGAGGR